MAYQGLIQDLEGHALKVVFPFGGTVHEVLLPPVFDEEHPLKFPHRPDSEEAGIRLREEAGTVLQCLTWVARAALEQQRALATAGPEGSLCMDLPPFLSELHGSFIDLVQQLQDCVHQRRQPPYVSPSPVALLVQAARLGHLAAAQQLLLIEPGAAHGDGSDVDMQPVMWAASRSAATLRLLLAAAPAAVNDTCANTSNDQHEWTAMHSAASGGNAEAVSLLLQLVPHLASASTDEGRTPLHEAAERGSPEAVQLLLAAAPETASAADSRGWLPTQLAALHLRTGALRTLIDAGAPGLDVLAPNGALPLHMAAAQDDPEPARLLLDACPAAALIRNSDGYLPLQVGLQLGSLAVCRALLFAPGFSTDQRLDLLLAAPADAVPLAEALCADLAAHARLSVRQWLRVPAPCLGLGGVLPTVLERSQREAGLLVAHLSTDDADRLQTAALSLHRMQRSLQLKMPPTVLRRILALALSDV